MDPQVFQELNSIKVKLEAVKNSTVSKEEGHDLLVECTAKLETILAMFTDAGTADKRSLVDKIIRP